MADVGDLDDAAREDSKDDPEHATIVLR